jgi:chaperonin GroEL
MEIQMGKEVRFGSGARQGLQEGLDILANAVKATLGPRGRNAAIERRFGPPLITKDGVTVAKSISLDDRLQNMGAELIKSVASATNNAAGDGTTTATVLAQAIYTEGSKMVSAGHNPVLIKRGIDKAVDVVVTKLNDISQSVDSEELINSVAVISANNDLKLGNLIGSVVSAVGNDGMISVEEATSLETSVSYTEGVNFERGYITPTFATNLEKLTCELDSPYVLLYDGRITATSELLPILEMISEENRSLLIVAQTVENEALQTLVVNKARGSLMSCAVRAPGFGDIRRDMLEDIATVCGGTLFTSELNNSLRGLTVKDLGQARKVVISRSSTSIIDGLGTQDAVDERVHQIKSQLDQQLETFQYAALKQRLSALSGAVAVLSIGGLSETEVREKKDRVEDAINAVKAAIEEGIVPGGGAALLHCVKDLNALRKEPMMTEELVGVDIVLNAIKAPFKQVLANSGEEHHSYMEKIISSKNKTCGFDALRGVFVSNMVEEGIIDPVKVVRSAIQNAASASGTLLTTEVTVCESDAEGE